MMIAILLFVIAAVTVWLVVRHNLDVSGITKKRGEEVVSLSTLWESQQYEQLTQMADDVLAESPLSAEALIYGGFGYFYRGVSNFSLEEQIPLFDRSIVLLRKALALDSTPFKAQIRYILGKAYYHKGKFYVDLAIRYLEEAMAMGYLGDDTFEYLGLAYSAIGSYKESADYFLNAVEQNNTDIRMLTLAQVYTNIGEDSSAEEYLIRTLNKTEDLAIEQKARFMLGGIYFDRGDYTKAEDQYNKVLEANPRSADAHYFLGEIFLAFGDNVKARDEWRKAYRIDESHYGARLRLFAN